MVNLRIIRRLVVGRSVCSTFAMDPVKYVSDMDQLIDTRWGRIISEQDLLVFSDMMLVYVF